VYFTYIFYGGVNIRHLLNSRILYSALGLGISIGRKIGSGRLPLFMVTGLWIP